MPNPQYLTLAATGGAYVTVLATSVCRRVEVIEDFGSNAGVGQGLEYLLPDQTSGNPTVPSWVGIAGSTANPTAATTGFKIAPQTEPIILGQTVAFGSGSGLVLGHGPDNSGGYSIAATPLIMVRSASASTTTIRVTELG
jgi:hypothetical protein